MKRKLLGSFALLSLVAIILFSSFAKRTLEPKGNIEGYVFPKEAKPFVKIVLPHPSKNKDTIHREAHANAQGYYKFPNLEDGTYQLIYFAREAGYKRHQQTISVSGGSLTNAGEVTLEKLK